MKNANSKINEVVKSRHSRENGNPGNSNYMKILDSCFRRNDKKSLFRLFTRSSKLTVHYGFINVGP